MLSLVLAFSQLLLFCHSQSFLVHASAQSSRALRCLTLSFTLGLFCLISWKASSNVLAMPYSTCVGQHEP